LNGKLRGFQILKSSEVDILADGSLDYPDELLKELDYTVCSIHSRFALGQEAQTGCILRAMDNRYFNILGHATGRLLLKRRMRSTSSGLSHTHGKTVVSLKQIRVLTGWTSPPRTPAGRLRQAF
jgi:histidinol phosphatase-like PHP family hydrolase